MDVTVILGIPNGPLNWEIHLPDHYTTLRGFGLSCAILDAPYLQTSNASGTSLSNVDLQLGEFELYHPQAVLLLSVGLLEGKNSRKREVKQGSGG